MTSPTHAESVELARQARAGDLNARAELVVRNLPLAYHAARKWSVRRLEPQDARQEAALALVRAADAFDPARGTTLATLATPTMIRQLSRAATNALPLHTPYRVGALAGKLRGVRSRMSFELGRLPTIAELAEHESLHPYQVEVALTVPETTVELDGSMAASLKEDPMDAAMGRVVGEELRQAVENALQRLRPRQAQVVRLRVVQGLTLEATGRALGMTREGARQLEARGLKALRQDTMLERWGP